MVQINYTVKFCYINSYMTLSIELEHWINELILAFQFQVLVGCSFLLIKSINVFAFKFWQPSSRTIISSLYDITMESICQTSRIDSCNCWLHFQSDEIFSFMSDRQIHKQAYTLPSKNSLQAKIDFGARHLKQLPNILRLFTIIFVSCNQHMATPGWWTFVSQPLVIKTC